MPKKIYYAAGYEPTPFYVTDGLVAYWDAGDPASYPGSGSSWFDLTANALTIPISNPTYVSLEGGYFDNIPGVSYFNTSIITSSDPASLAGAIEFSIEFWVNLDTGIPFTRIIEKSNAGLGAGGYTIHYDAAGQVTLTINGAQLSLGVLSFGSWEQHIIIRDASNDVRHYVNSSLVFGPTNYAETISLASGLFTLGRRSVSLSRVMDGKISCCRLYNKELSASEVTINYNQLKGRYGLP